MRLCDLDEIKICVDRQYENCHGYSGSKKAIYREAILAVKSILHSAKSIDGVTVQEWVSVEDKLPPYNRDVLAYRPNMAMKFVVDTYDGYYGDDDDEWYEGWARYGKDIHGKPIITHWAYLPQPPKGE